MKQPLKPKNLPPLPQRSPVDELGGELLEESGFEEEMPDPDFTDLAPHRD